METVPINTIYAMTLAFVTCIFLPMGFLIAMRKKVLYKGVLLGFAAYIALGYFISGLLQKYIAGGITSPLLFALAISVVIVAVEETGRYYLLSLLRKLDSSAGVPLSFGFGYSLLQTLWVSGRSAFITLATAFAIDDKGMDTVLDTVEGNRDQLRERLVGICQSDISAYLLGTGEVICFFSNCISISAIMWYSVTGKCDRKYLWMAMAARFIVELPVSFYSRGGLTSPLTTDIVYFALSALLLAGAILLRRIKEGPGETPMASPVKRD